MSASPAPASAPSTPLLSVLVPAYNEEGTIAEILEKVKRVPIDKEIIVVDDGSKDRTREILAALAKEDPNLRIVFQPQNRGKGFAIRTAIEHARGKICIVQDADLEYDPEDYPALIAPILEGRTKVVYGSRPMHPANQYPFDIYRIASFMLTWTTNVLYLCRISDEPTCYKVFDTTLLKSIPLRCEGFEFCPEVTAKVRKRGERIHEVPIRYYKRGLEEGKKIRFKDAFVAVWTLVKYRFVN